MTAARPATVDVPRLSFSLREAGQILGVSHETVRRMILAGDLPTRRVGRRHLIPRAALERFGQVPTGRVERGAGGGPSESSADPGSRSAAAAGPSVVVGRGGLGGPSSTEQSPGDAAPGLR